MRHTNRNPDCTCEFCQIYRLKIRVAELESANQALIEVERRIREFSPRFTKWMEEANAPQEIREAYKWAIYGSAVHAQAFIVKDKP